MIIYYFQVKLLQCHPENYLNQTYLNDIFTTLKDHFQLSRDPAGSESADFVHKNGWVFLVDVGLCVTLRLYPVECPWLTFTQTGSDGLNDIGCIVDRKLMMKSVFSPLTSEVCEKSSRWLWKESCLSTGVRKPGNTCASPTAMI